MDIKNTQKAIVYLHRVLRDYRFTESESPGISSVAKELYPAIREWAKPYLVRIQPSALIRIQPSGSFVKKTNIKGNTDIDLLLSLPSHLDISLRDIYFDLSGYLTRRGFMVQEQNVSLGVKYKGLKIDLVPAKRQPNTTYYHSIYKRKTDSWTKTNVHKHILLIRNSNRLNEIRVLKIWRNLRELEFPSLLLELSVIRALKNCQVGRLPHNVMKVFEYLSTDFPEARIVDPSNKANVLSNDITEDERNRVSQNAYESLYATSWIHIVW